MKVFESFFAVCLFHCCTLACATSLPPAAAPVLWLDAGNADSLVLDRHCRVLEWRSRSQQHISLNQGNTSRRPVLNKSFLNGKPGVCFNGTEWLETVSQRSGDILTKQFSVFVVLQIEEEHPLRLMGFMGTGGLDKNRPGMMLGFNDSHIVNWNNSVALAVHDGVRPLVAAAKGGDSRKLGLARTVPTRFPVLISTVFRAGMDAFAVIRLQGKNIDHKLPPVPVSAGINLVSGLAVGAADRWGSHPFRGAISEILVYDRALTECETKQTDDWLKSRHNLEMPSPIILDPRVQYTSLAIRAQAITQNGTLLRIAEGAIHESSDGEVWKQKFTVTPDPSFPDLRLAGGLLSITPAGTMVLIMRDQRPEGFAKLKRVGNAFNNQEAKSHIYAFRSLDGGRTWRDGKLLQTAYCGAMRDIKVTSAGHIIVSVQAWEPQAERHVTMVYTSTDDGKTYRSSKVDNGIGQGMHDGFFEATLAELNNGDILMLGRTCLGVFWESRSKDGGLTWSKPVKTDIDAGGYPGFLIRLKSGRIMLAWNRFYPDGRKGRNDLINMAGKSWFWGAQPSSRFNRELSIMFSDDNGKNWTSPVVAAEGRQDFAALSYPFLMEREPGEIYIWAGTLAAKLREKDFCP